MRLRRSKLQEAVEVEVADAVAEALVDGEALGVSLDEPEPDADAEAECRRGSRSRS